MSLFLAALHLLFLPGSLLDVVSEGLLIPFFVAQNLIPMGRFGMPEEIASVVELLISNAYMTNKVRTASPSTRAKSVLMVGFAIDCRR